jgi:hypothetical protein
MSDSFEFKLIPLDCPTCGAGIQARGEDVVYYCTACRNGYTLEESDWSLRLLETSFVAVSNLQVEEYRPFWLLPAEIHVSGRSSSSAGLAGIWRTLMGDNRSPATSGQGLFAVPAFRAPLEAVTLLVRRYTEALPALAEKLGERLLGGCYGPQDAEKLAHYSLIASEVDSPGVLLELEYELVFGPARLLGVPFVSKADRVMDAIFSIEV